MISLILSLSLVTLFCHPTPRQNFLNFQYVSHTLNLTHDLLNLTNPMLARDFWLCLLLLSGKYVGTPTPLKAWTTSNISFYLKLHEGPPVSGVNIHSILSKSPKDFMGLTLQQREKNLHSYLTSISTYISLEMSTLGPVTTNTVLTHQVPWCITQVQNQSTQFLGHLPNNLCNFTITIAPFLNHLHTTRQTMFNVGPYSATGGGAVQRVTSTHYRYISAPPKLSTPSYSPSSPFSTSSASAFCSGKPIQCLTYCFWQSYSPSLQTNCKQLPSHDSQNSKFLIEEERKLTFFENTTFINYSQVLQENPLGPLQPLTADTLSGTFTVWENEQKGMMGNPTWLFSIENVFCLKELHTGNHQQIHGRHDASALHHQVYSLCPRFLPGKDSSTPSDSLKQL